MIYQSLLITKIPDATHQLKYGARVNFASGSLAQNGHKPDRHHDRKKHREDPSGAACELVDQQSVKNHALKTPAKLRALLKNFGGIVATRTILRARAARIVTL